MKTSDIFVKNLVKKNIFLPKNFFPWWRRLIFSTKISLKKMAFFAEKHFSLIFYFIFVENLVKKTFFFAEKLFSLMKTSDIFVKNLVKKHFLPKTFFPDEDVWYFRRKFG